MLNPADILVFVGGIVVTGIAIALVDRWQQRRRPTSPQSEPSGPPAAAVTSPVAGQTDAAPEQAEEPPLPRPVRSPADTCVRCGVRRDAVEYMLTTPEGYMCWDCYREAE